MKNRIVNIIQSVPFVARRIAKKKEEALKLTKHYTFMLTGTGVLTHVNIVADDKKTASEKVRKQYPGYNINFLWEYVRTRPIDLEML